MVYTKALFQIAIYILSLVAFFTWAPAFAETPPYEKSAKDVCSQLKFKSKEAPFAYLISPSGKIDPGPIQLGTIDVAHATFRNEGFLVGTKYRVVAPSRKFVAGTATSNSSQTFLEKIKSTCPGTSEFSLSFNLTSIFFGPGNFDYPPLIDLDDPTAYYPSPPELRFDFRLVGSILSPKPELIETNASSKDIAEFLTGAARSVTLTLKNTGNAPLIITDLVDLATLTARKSTQTVIRQAREACADTSPEVSEICTLQVQKKRDDCIGSPIPPDGTCNIELEKNSDSPLTGGSVYVLKIKSNYLLGYNPRIEFKINANREVTGGLKLR